MAHMHQRLSYNMGAINFWLQSCVFKAETSQYPSRLKATAWHLAANARGAVVGFRCAPRRWRWRGLPMLRVAQANGLG